MGWDELSIGFSREIREKWDEQREDRRLPYLVLESSRVLVVPDPIKGEGKLPKNTFTSKSRTRLVALAGGCGRLMAPTPPIFPVSLLFLFRAFIFL